MPRMQVTFSNAAVPTANPALAEQLSTLMFQIEYRGKLYDCVGHVRQAIHESSKRSRLRFSGYYGYNGPIDIQKLRDAAIDYYQSVTQNSEPGLKLVTSSVDHQPDAMAESSAVQPIVNKSYAFNVGRHESPSLQKAS